MESSAYYSLKTGLGDYDRLSILNKYYNPGTRQLLHQAKIQPSASVVDIGCGHGEVTFILSSEFAPKGNILGVDADPKQIEVAKIKVDSLENVSLLCNDIYTLDLPDESFDYLYCRCLLIHLPDPKAALANMIKLLKPGGKLICEEVDVRGLRCIPEKKGFDRWMRYWFNLGRSLGVAYDFPDRMFQTLLDLNLKIKVFQINQPVSWSQDAKALHVLGFQQLVPLYIKKGGATERDIEALQQLYDDFLSEPKTYVELYRINQFIAEKPIVYS